MTQSEPVARVIPDPRSPTDRRQRDGLGLLPRTTSVRERRRRSELNRLIGWLLLVLGLTSWSAGLIQVLRAEASDLLGPVLGLVIAARGLQLVTWKDRRKADRRRSERPALPDPWPELAAAVPRSRRRWRFRRPGGPQVAPGSDVQVSPPEVD